MEKKKFNRGTINGGIIKIIIAVIAIAIALIVLITTINSWDSENIAGGVFMCLISSIMIVASPIFIISGTKMIIDGKKSLEVSKKGHPENGKIINLSATEITETNNTCVSHYIVYNLKFEYTSDDGKLCESQEQISEKTYRIFQEQSLVPILVYGERAIFDKKRFEHEMANNKKN